MAGRAVVRRVDDLPINAFPVHVAMAIDAPAHRQVRKLPHPLHGLHRAVTALTLHAGADVCAMIETGKGGKIVYAAEPFRAFAQP